MVNFNIKNYLVEEEVIRPNFEGVFYGELEDKPDTEQKLFFFYRTNTLETIATEIFGNKCLLFAGITCALLFYNVSKEKTLSSQK